MGSKIQQPSSRMSDHHKYLDRQTVQWLEKKTSMKSEADNPPKLGPTWADLTRTRTYFSHIRISPISKVSKCALHAFPSERVCELAQPRPYANGWLPDLPLPTPVSKASLNAVASPRTCRLAQPKMRPKEPQSGYMHDPRPMTHLTSTHLSMLAVPKGEHPMYERQRSVCWPVSVAARNYIPTQRLLELSSPKIRRDVFDGYDPFIVSHAALCANPSPRTLQLSVPLARKCTPKATPLHHM